MRRIAQHCVHCSVRHLVRETILCYAHWEAKTALTIVRRSYDRKGRGQSDAEALPERLVEAEVDDSVVRAISLVELTNYCRMTMQTTESSVQALPFIILLNL